MRVALIQMMVTADKVGNINTACEKLREAAVNGADIAVLLSLSKRLFPHLR